MKTCKGCSRPLPDAHYGHPWCDRCQAARAEVEPRGGTCAGCGAWRPADCWRCGDCPKPARKPSRRKGVPRTARAAGQTKCGRCRATLGPTNRSGYCAPCRKVSSCKFCRVPTGGGTCEACAVVLGWIAEAHAGDQGPRPPWVAGRVERYAARAEAKEPLFAGV